MPTQVIMPKLGESVVEGTVTAWLKKEGEEIEEFEPLLEVNTDKVDTEVPSPASGTVLKILIPEGETVAAGTILAWLGEPGEALPEGGKIPEHDHEPPEKPNDDSIAYEPLIQQAAGRNADLGPLLGRIDAVQSPEAEYSTQRVLAGIGRDLQHVCA